MKAIAYIHRHMIALVVLVKEDVAKYCKFRKDCISLTFAFFSVLIASDTK